MTRLSTAALAFVLCLMVSAASAENWPHWRGEAGNGVSTTAKPPTNWSGEKNVKWKVRIPGKGSGSPIIWENKVFVVSGVPMGGGAATEAASRSRSRRGAPLETLQFKLFCFDRATGDKIWEQTAVVAKPHQATHDTNNFASASPCTDGEHVYAHFGSRGLYCYTMDGKLKWKRDDLGKMQTRSNFGEGSSPTIEGEKIIVPWDHEGQSAIYALNKRTGETIWKTKRDEPTCWATPLVIEYRGKKQIIMNGERYARAYDLETGKELWRCGGQTERPVASAVTSNGLVFVGSGFRGSFLGAFSPAGKGDIEGTAYVAWSVSRDTPDIASPLISSGRLYYHKAKTGVLTCVDAATGKVHFPASRIRGLRSIYASPIAAGGHVYLTDRNGTIVVIKDAEELEIVATNSIGEGVDATPAPVDNQLFIRGEQHLYCIEAD